MDLADEIKKLAEPWLTESQFIVDVMISSKKAPRKVLVLADSDQGFTIDDCAELSRHLSKALDEGGLIEENYFLEVSTPGVDHPLKLKRQYFKNIGRSLKVKFQDKIMEGKLSAVTEDIITLAQETGTGKNKEIKLIDLPFAEIEKAFVQVSFK
jgi:ribosome maturation factor RimP